MTREIAPVRMPDFDPGPTTRNPCAHILEQIRATVNEINAVNRSIDLRIDALMELQNAGVLAGDPRFDRILAEIDALEIRRAKLYAKLAHLLDLYNDCGDLTLEEVLMDILMQEVLIDMIYGP